MSNTPNLNLMLTPEDDTTTTFKDWRTGINGEDSDSNMMKIDEAYGALDEQTRRLMEIVNINSVDVVVKGTEDLYYNAVWFDDGESFSITSNHGVEKQVIIDMISSGDYTLEPNMEKEI